MENGDITVGDVDVALALAAEVGDELFSFEVVVDGFDGLLEADGDEQADADGGDVEEEVLPGVSGLVGWVDVEHKTEDRG